MVEVPFSDKCTEFLSELAMQLLDGIREKLNKVDHELCHLYMVQVFSRTSC